MVAPHRLDPARISEHLPPLYRAARAWTGSKEEAEDLVQEMFLHVLAKPRLIMEDDLGYLMRAMHNTLVSRRRAAGRRPVSVELHEDLEVMAHDRDDPVTRAENAEVFALISQLPDDYADALVAVDVVGLSYKEASRLLGVPEGTVTSRLFRARDQLARRLGGQ